MAAKKKTTPRSAAAKKAPAKRPAAKAGKAPKAARAGGRPAAKKAGAARKGAGARIKRPALKPRKSQVKEAAEPPRPPQENPAARTLARRAGAVLFDRKAADIVVLDVRGRTSYADYLVVASGESERHVNSLAEAVEVELKKENHRTLSTEGQTPGQWILLDYGDVVVHLFAQEARAFYDLEGVWPDVPREQVLA